MVVPFVLGGASAIASALGGTRILAALGGIELLGWVPGFGGGSDSGPSTGLLLIGGLAALIAVALVIQ